MKRNWLSIVLVVAVEAYCLRGGFEPYPLQAEDIVVSPDKQFNSIVPNALYMLKKAKSDLGKGSSPLNGEEALERYGFTALQEACDAFAEGMGRPIPVKICEDTLATLNSLLFSHAEHNKNVQKHNIVLLMSESWGYYLSTLSSKNCQLMPEMERHLHEDLLFDNFTSVRNGTARSLECLTVATPFKGFFFSPHHYTTLPTSIAKAFCKSGYSTTFITGMDPGWGNVQEGLTVQGFDDIVAMYEMKSAHPEYKECCIGVYDHYMLNSLMEILEKPAKSPKFIMGLTTTNHPPLDLPDDIKLPELPDTLVNSRNFSGKRDVVRQYLRGFQYANQSIGNLLTRFKESPAADNTIIIICGDHSLRSIIDYNNVDESFRNRILMYVYLPPALRQPHHKSATHKYGNHYDILPTLASFALNDVDYLHIGRDLLADSSSVTECAYNEDALLCDERQRARAERFTNAREALLNIYFDLFLKKNELPYPRTHIL